MDFCGETWLSCAQCACTLPESNGTLPSLNAAGTSPHFQLGITIVNLSYEEKMQGVVVSICNLFFTQYGMKVQDENYQAMKNIKPITSSHLLRWRLHKFSRLSYLPISLIQIEHFPEVIHKMKDDNNMNKLSIHYTIPVNVLYPTYNHAAKIKLNHSALRLSVYLH